MAIQTEPHLGTLVAGLVTAFALNLLDLMNTGQLSRTDEIKQRVRVNHRGSTENEYGER